LDNVVRPDHLPANAIANYDCFLSGQQKDATSLPADRCGWVCGINN
jgi:hypothetical protein